MSEYAVELSPDALSHVEGVIEWWRFLDELKAVLRQLERSPFLGKLYEAPGVRVLLARRG